MAVTDDPQLVTATDTFLTTGSTGMQVVVSVEIPSSTVGLYTFDLIGQITQSSAQFYSFQGNAVVSNHFGAAVLHGSASAAATTASAGTSVGGGEVGTDGTRLQLRASGSAGAAWRWVGTIDGLQVDPGLFIPTAISGCTMWLRSDLGIELAVTGVARWRDQSGRGHHVGHGTQARRPDYVLSSGSMPHPFVRFNGAAGGQFLTSSAYSLGPTLQRFCVCVMDRRGGQISTVVDGLTPNSNAGRIYTGAANDPRIFNGTAEVGQGGSTADSTTWHRFDCRFTNTNAGELRVDSGSHGVGNPGASTPNGMTIGVFGDQSSAPAQCDVAEIIEYDHTLTAAELASVNDYLARRYGAVVT